MEVIYLRPLRSDTPIPGSIPITNISDLQRIGNDTDFLLDGDYYLTNDIDASDTSTWNLGAGFDPIGENDTIPFTGTFDGRGYNITGLYINRPSQDFVGLFSSVRYATIRDVGLREITVTGSSWCGGLAGAVQFSTITNSFADGSVSGDDRTGGLIGSAGGNRIINSHYDGIVTGNDSVGGVAGVSLGNTVSISYSTGTVSGYKEVGGLVGYAGSCPISNSYFIGTVTGSDNSVGGLVGEAHSSTIANSSFNGSVSGYHYVGGLVGWQSGGIITNSYSTGTVTGSSEVGGLVGWQSGGIITNSYSTGSVTGGGWDGGLIGHRSSGTVINSYWNTDNSGPIPGVGHGSSAGVTGKNTTEMKKQSTYSNWDFTWVWGMVENETYPSLESQWYRLIGKGTDAYGLFINGNRSIIRGRIGESVVNATVDEVQSWHHYAMTYNGTNLTIYINGLEVNSADIGAVLGTNTNDLTIGDPFVGFPGMVDEVKIYNISMNGSEIWSNYMATFVPPVIITQDRRTAVEDVQYHVDYDYEHPNHKAGNWSCMTIAPFLSFDNATGILMGTPVNSDVGLYWVNITCGDGSRSSSHNFTLTVLNANDAPVISAEVDIDVFDGMTYRVDFNAMDIDPTFDTLTWNMTTNASWLSSNASTGIVIGTPSNGDLGMYWVNVSVTDGHDGHDWLNYTLTVININDAPMITTLDNTTATEDRYYFVDYDAVDADPTKDTLEWSLYTDAAWLEINASTGVLNGTPTNADVGLYWVMIKVEDGQGGSVTRVFLLNVENINDAPVIRTIDAVQAMEDEFYSIYYEADDIDLTGDTLNWSLTTNASWLALDDDHLHGLPGNEEVGSFWVNITVADGQGGSDWTNFTLHVYPDFDGDGVNDIVDPDDDNDGVEDTQDDFPYDASETMDNDGDGIGDNGDNDDDNDGWSDTLEKQVGTDALNNNSFPPDTDGDLTPDALDSDDDNDGWSDVEEDVYGTDPLDNSSVPLDTDDDGTPDAWDQDDDNDGWPDSIEELAGTDTKSSASMPKDEDNNGIADFVETYEQKQGEITTETPLWAYLALVAAILLGLLALLMYMWSGMIPMLPREEEAEQVPDVEETGDEVLEEEELEVKEDLDESEDSSDLASRDRAGEEEEAEERVEVVGAEGEEAEEAVEEEVEEEEYDKVEEEAAEAAEEMEEKAVEEDAVEAEVEEPEEANDEIEETEDGNSPSATGDEGDGTFITLSPM